MIVEAINQYLQKRPREERRTHCFHPSALHLPAEALYRAYFGEAVDYDARFLRIFDNGHCVHERLQGYLKEIGILKAAEIEVFNEEYEIYGRADGIVEVVGLEGVLEIKSLNSNTFYSCYDASPNHLVQLNAYMFCIGIPRGVLLYECKDNQELKEFYVKQDERILTPILEKIKHVQSCIKQGREPSGGNSFHLSSEQAGKRGK